MYSDLRVKTVDDLMLSNVQSYRMNLYQQNRYIIPKPGKKDDKSANYGI